MSLTEEQENIIYEAVVNDEEQYSIWPADLALPIGWRPAGRSGSKSECLAWIGEVWTDMRPLRLRNRMQGMSDAETKA